MNQIIVVNKPAGMTSQAVDTRIKRILQVKHVGHLGTLDPLATGVLVVMTGSATKLASFMENDDKDYLATICFGLKTDTLDITGHPIDILSKPSIDLNKFDEVLTSFKGEIKQVPPQYSALKVNGKKMYEYARKGITLDIPKRIITIYDIKRASEIRSDEQYLYVDFEVHCSKGTYVRTLIDDIGNRLGIPCCMSGLTRIKSGKFSLADSATIEDIEKGEYKYFKMQDALSIPIFAISDEVYKKVSNGMKLSPKTFDETYDMVGLTYHDTLVAVYQYVTTDIKGYHPIRVWNDQK